MYKRYRVLKHEEIYIMSDLRIDSDYKVKGGYNDYSTPTVKGKDDDFKKKLEMNSIHVPQGTMAWMPAGGIGGLLNGSTATTHEA